MKYLFAMALVAIFVSCKQETGPVVMGFDNPGNQLGSEPNLHLSQDGTIFLSWIEAKKGENSKLLFSTLNENDLNWSEPILIAQGSDWFVNWADFPSITSFGDKSLAAHYLDKSADDTYAYDVNIITSNDRGTTWNNAFVPHTDKTNTEHGFVSKVAMSNNKLLSVWLDGRKYAYSEVDSNIVKEMTLRAATFNEDDDILEEYELDVRVCDCCQTDTAMTQNGPIVVYRDRSDIDIRDISCVRLVNGKWTDPKPIHTDNWSIFGCPVNGPAISTMNNKVAVTWFTNANDAPKVKVAFSENNGETFSTPIIIDQDSPSGRVDIEMLSDGSSLVSWLGSEAEKAVIRLQRVHSNNRKSQIITVSESSENRSSGFPRMIVKNDLAYLVWTNSADTLTIKTSKINLDKLQLE